MIQGFLIIIFFIVFIVFLGVIGVRNAKNNEDSLGKTPINKFLFILAKFTFLVPWIISLFGAVKPEFLPDYYSNELAWVGVLLITFGFIIVIAGYVQLGKYTRFGLPTKESKLITTGIFKYSRNPMYLGLFLMIIGIFFYFPHWILAVCVIISIVLHHQITLAEEKFMEHAFGKEWDDFKKVSKRYLLW